MQVIKEILQHCYVSFDDNIVLTKHEGMQMYIHVTKRARLVGAHPTPSTHVQDVGQDDDWPNEDICHHLS